MNRRTFLYRTTAAAAASSAFTRFARAVSPSIKVGICDWNLGEQCDPGMIPVAAEAGLDGIQVSVATRPDSVPLRDPAFRQQYLDLGARHGIAFPSTAAGSILNNIPLKSEPEAVVYVIDAVEAAAALGADNILVAFFADADLRLRDAMGDFRNLSDGPFSEYELDTEGVTRVVAALRQIAPRARDAGVVLGLENTLTARQNLEIIDRVGSDFVKVYYDVGNSTAYGYDVPGEIRMLGKDLITEIHIKETLGLRDPMWALLGGPSTGGVDFEGAAAAVREIGFDRWFILETGGREGREVADTRANAAFVKRLFG
ncbi:MAG: sugar phosphate isomerase/epimerase family protein [Rhodothermales bacterium]